MNAKKRGLSRRILFLALLALFLLSVILIAAHFWPLATRQQAQSCAPASHLPTNSAEVRGAPPLYLGLEAYRNLDKLSYLELGDRVEGQSTADIAGSNHDNVQVVRALPNGERVLFDAAGPGIVTFLRMQESYGGPWHLSLDAHDAATIGSSDLGQLNPTGNPARAFPYPLSLNPQESQGSSILAAPIPFQQSMTWTSQQANGNFYALYRKLPYGYPLATWNANTPISDVVGLLRCAGSDIAPPNLTRQSGQLALPVGKETPVVTLSGPAQIRVLTFQVPDREMASFGNARLLISWNGERQPSVDAPLKFLAGDGAGAYQPAGRSLVQGLLAGISSDTQGMTHFNLYWPMPFTSRARIALVSGVSLGSITWNVGYEPFPDPPQWWGTFHATYTSIAKPQPGQDMNFLDARGSGKLVGAVINFTRPGGTLEGDPHIYIDDSQTPQIAVTGTEEWGLGGDYWHGGTQVSLPLGGLPSSVNNPPGSNIDGASLYRFLIADSIPFNRHLLVRWEHGGQDESALPYRAVMLWYGTPAQTAQLSDDLLPASTASRAAHSYQATGEQPYALTSAYGYTVHSPLISGSGIASTGEASFRLTLNPSNVGAFLRRTFDVCIANQRANIYIDGAFAGTWYTAGASTRVDVDDYSRCWRDEDFPLPASLTMGKSSITVRVVFAPTTNPPDSAWTAFRYQVYSLVLPNR